MRLHGMQEVTPAFRQAGFDSGIIHTLKVIRSLGFLLLHPYPGCDTVGILPTIWVRYRSVVFLVQATYQNSYLGEGIPRSCHPGSREPDIASGLREGCSTGHITPQGRRHHGVQVHRHERLLAHLPHRKQERLCQLRLGRRRAVHLYPHRHGGRVRHQHLSAVRVFCVDDFLISLGV